MEKVRLGNIATIITKGTTPTSLGYDFVENGINFVKIECITEDGDFIEDKFAHITAECNEKLNRSQLQENDILFSIAGAIGRVAIVDKSILPANTNQALAIIRVPKGIYEYNFLKYILKSPVIIKQFEKQKQGVAQINLSLKNISDFEIPVISLEQQGQVSLVLDKVTDLIEKRKQQLEKLDELVKARFVELFGDPILNPKGFVEGSVSEYCKMTQGTQIPMSEQINEYQQGYYRYLYIRDLKYNDSDWIYVQDKYDDKKLTEKDLVVVNTGNTAGEIYYGKDGILSNNLFKVSFDADVLNTTYMFAYFSSQQFQSMLWNEMKEGTQPHLGHKIFGSKKLIIPPMDEQNRFAAFVKQTDKSKLEVQKSLEKLELLKKALMQKYFA